MTGVPEMEPPIDPASLQEAGSGVTSSVQTVTNSARRAVDFFVREIPSLKSNKAIQ